MLTILHQIAIFLLVDETAKFMTSLERSTKTACRDLKFLIAERCGLLPIIMSVDADGEDISIGTSILPRYANPWLPVVHAAAHTALIVKAPVTMQPGWVDRARQEFNVGESQLHLAGGGVPLWGNRQVVGAIGFMAAEACGSAPDSALVMDMRLLALQIVAMHGFKNS